MNETNLWTWLALLGLGAFHGINPGMGWLFAVAIGLQERSSKAVWHALWPIALGHALSICMVVLVALVLGQVIPLLVLKGVVAVALLACGGWRLFKSWHPRWGGIGMRMGWVSLALWSFLMASAHGAGLMLVPLLMHLPHPTLPSGLPAMVSMRTGLAAVGVHSLAYLVVTGLAAWVVYRKFGLALLRKAWFNLDLVWSIALLITAGFVMLM